MVSTKKRVTLRLDDGSLIGSGEFLTGDTTLAAVLLTVEDAARLGRVGEADVARLSSLLSQARTLTNSSNGIHHLACNGIYGTKRSADVITTAIAPAKRICPQPSLPTSAVHLSSSKLSADMQLCAKLLKKMYTKLGKNKSLFYHPVDEKLAPGYYKFTKQPICFQQIESKLKSGGYDSAVEFAADVRLLWSNCKAYNRVNDWIWNLGNDNDQFFDKVWRESGLDPALPGFGALATVPSIKREHSTAMTSDCQDSQGDFGPQNPRRSRRPRIPNRRLSSPSMDTSMEDDGVVQAVPSLSALNAAAVTATAESSKWSDDKLDLLTQQVSELAESEEFMNEVQAIVLHDPAYAHLSTADQTEISLDLIILAPHTLSQLNSLVLRYKSAKSQPTQPPSVNPSPHSTQTSMQQQPPPAASQLQAKAAPSMSMERKTSLTHALMDLIVDPSHMAKVSEIITACGVDTEDGELDMSTLDDAVMWKLDAFVQQALGSKYQPDGKVVDEDGSSSSDSDSDDSDD